MRGESRETAGRFKRFKLMEEIEEAFGQTHTHLNVGTNKVLRWGTPDDQRAFLKALKDCRVLVVVITKQVRVPTERESK